MKLRIFFALTALAVVVYGNACSPSFKNDLPAETPPDYGFYTQLGAVTKPVSGATNMDESCTALARDSQGNVICAGRTSGALAGPSAGGEDLFVIKFNSNGQIVWAMQTGTSGNEGCNGIAVDHNDDIFCGGSTTGDLSGDTGVLSVDAFITKIKGTNGDVDWTAQFNDTNLLDAGADAGQAEACNDVAVDPSGNVFCIGDTTGDIVEAKAGSRNLFAVKLNGASKAMMWAKQFGGTTLAGIMTTNGNEIGLKGRTDANGNLFVAGTTGGAFLEAHGGGTTDAFVLKMASVDGAVLWGKQFGNVTVKSGGSNAGQEEITGLATDSLGDVYVSLTTTGDMGELGDSKDIVVAKLSNAGSGALEWLTQLGQATTYTYSTYADPFIGTNSGAQEACTVGVNSKDEIFCAGYTNSDMGELRVGASPDAMVMKMTATGGIEWLKQWGQKTKATGKDNSGSDQLTALAFTDDDGLYAGGFTSGGFAEANGGGRDILVFKMKTNGQLPPVPEN